PTGGYRIELDDPDIVYPVTGKRGKITITGKFHKPGKSDYVTQAFTTPSETVQIGKLPGGEYDIIAVIEGLGQLMRTLIVK
ncbi:MAG TPA: protease complex subunit PrcB family protein, partial [Fervidobacterium sp.]|nr:protease complex subunit PrcB family protein [Fervidobacterium sp.]